MAGEKRKQAKPPAEKAAEPAVSARRPTAPRPGKPRRAAKRPTLSNEPSRHHDTMAGTGMDQEPTG